MIPSPAVVGTTSSEGFFVQIRQVLVALVTVIILTLFMLASGPPSSRE